MRTHETPRRRRWVTFAVTALIVVGGVATSVYWLENKPRAKRAAPVILAPLVETIDAQSVTHQVNVPAMGTVTAAQSVELSARVSGELVEVSRRLVPGECFKKGELIARIDPTDFELALRRAEADLVNARYELELELGKRAVALREYELLGETIAEEDRALVLREPHLKNAQAKVDAAEAAVRQAKLDLERTRITAPFNAVVVERDASVGMQVNSGTKLATLAGSDRYWIEATLPVGELSWIRAGKNGSRAAITPRSPGQRFPEGKVRSIMSGVESKGRMARVVIEVPRPFQGGSGAPLLLGDLVTLSIEGKALENVIRIPRAALHEGPAIWLLSPDKRLKIVSVAPLWAEKDAVYVGAATVAEGDRLIGSSLAAPVEGMKLRTGGAQ
jgi:RND family efflux transporter MFP subunit